MPRYIDADRLTLKIDDWRADLEVTYGKNDDYVEALRDVLDIIKDAPTADVVKRKRSRSMWMESKNPFIRGTCSCCGWDAILFKTDVAGMSYCPNCGATMKGEEDDEAN